MRISTMGKLQAETEFEILIDKNFKADVNTLDDIMIRIRTKLTKYYYDLKKSYTRPYEIDLLFGLNLYKVLNEELNLKNDKTISSNINFWIYFSMRVIPDILYDRWGSQPNRFYKHNKRIWPLSIWWYIHLSWQNNEEETYEILKNNSTDTIVQLNERVGVGYDINLTKQLMKRLSHEKEKTQLFRRVMVLNTIYIHTIQPKLFENSYEGYVEMLFEKAKI